MSFHISDNHFNHENIIRYCNRPFDDVHEMQEYMIKKWNSVIRKGDIVYHHGDFALGISKEILTDIIKRLNGNIIMIYGNHDRKGVGWFKDCGIVDLHKKTITLDNKILSHRPLSTEIIPEGYLNIHGHVHNNGKYNLIHTNNGKLKSINVSCEVLDYTPIWID